MLDKNLHIAFNAMEHHHEGVLWIDVNGFIIYCNTALCNLLGYTKKDVLKRTIRDIDNSFDNESWETHLNRIRENQSIVIESTFYTINGATIPVEATLSCVIVDEDQFIVLFIRNNVEKKIGERAMRLVHFSVDKAKDGILWLNQTGHIIYVNDAACELLGYTHAEFHSKSFCEIDSQMQIQGFASMLDELKKKGSSVRETNFLTKSKLMIPVEITGHFIQFEEQEGCFLLARDRTEHKKAEEERKKLETQLQQVMKMDAIGRLAGGIAHDFNNILTGIFGNISLAMTALKPSDPLFDRLSQINVATERASTLVRQLLTFSRKQVIQPKTLNLNSIIENIKKFLVRIIGEDIRFQTIYKDNSLFVNVDPGQIEQIILNLVANSRDAMPNGGSLTIETGIFIMDEASSTIHANVKPGTYAQMTITDTGCGIPKGNLPHLFEPFFTTKSPGIGTGLGLSTVFGTVKQHNGSISVYSETDKGTSFKIYLPIVEHEKQSAPTTSSTPAEFKPGTEKILIVEDDEIVRNLAVTILSKNGYSVLAATGFDECEKRLDYFKIQIDLLLTDVIIPGKNGRELFQFLATKYPRLKVLYMSGYTDEIIAQHGILQKGVHFLQKPFSAYTLISKIRETLDSKTG